MRAASIAGPSYVQNTAASLTTFNEVDMSAVMGLRKQYQDLFVARHGIKLGFMSFFLKACAEALQREPEVNAVIDGDDIVYRNYVDVSVAVATPSGLVVPVVRDVDKKSLADIEKSIMDLATRVRGDGGGPASLPQRHTQCTATPSPVRPPPLSPPTMVVAASFLLEWRGCCPAPSQSNWQ